MGVRNTKRLSGAVLATFVALVVSISACAGRNPVNPSGVTISPVDPRIDVYVTREQRFSASGTDCSWSSAAGVFKDITGNEATLVVNGSLGDFPIEASCGSGAGSTMAKVVKTRADILLKYHRPVIHNPPYQFSDPTWQLMVNPDSGGTITMSCTRLDTLVYTWDPTTDTSTCDFKGVPVGAYIQITVGDAARWHVDAPGSSTVGTDIFNPDGSKLPAAFRLPRVVDGGEAAYGKVTADGLIK